jgi:hypothetical protein
MFDRPWPLYGARHEEKTMDPTIIQLPALFALLAFLASVIASTIRHRRELQLRADLHTRLLDRVTSAKEFVDLLATPAGRELAQSLLTTAAPAVGVHRAAQGLQIGIVLATVSVGCLSISVLVDFSDAVARQLFSVLGVIGLSLGVGYLLAAAAVHRYLAVSKNRT